MTDAGVNEYIVLAFTMIINFVTEFCYQRFVVFRKSINKNKRAKQQIENKKKIYN